MQTPKEVSLLPDGIHILWDDGHQGVHQPRTLRYECRCASCIHEMSGKRLIKLEQIPQDIQALDHMTIGRYALQFLWSDGHDTGIYPYVLLRRLCQCDVCAMARAHAAPPS